MTTREALTAEQCDDLCDPGYALGFAAGYAAGMEAAAVICEGFAARDYDQADGLSNSQDKFHFVIRGNRADDIAVDIRAAKDAP